ncbi:MAG: hypothetical protein BWK72_17415 [Rhodoferax ferrireducens]|uniref:Uncharacterized protein n=1 Tax=Rhodoferax ferrireducens TaxID=192843 RepID=A0A1W9KQD4_9BURK|nr:MAG: hypothetical protein BWK72_17415 [Rhodoferax ferrireducens]
MSHGPYTTYEDILSNALISDDPKIMQLDKLPPETLAYLVSGRLQGYLPVSVRWINGPSALMFCEPGTNMPSPQKIIQAYRQSQFKMNDSPDGGSL